MTLDETRRGVLDYAPGPYAVTRGPTHTLVYSNAAFHAVPGMLGVPTAGHPIAELFDRAIRARLTALLDRSLAEQCATRDQFLGPLGQAGTIWSCSVWPASVDAAAQELVVELRVATHTERTLSLQREVAERLLLSALRESRAAPSERLTREPVGRDRGSVTPARPVSGQCRASSRRIAGHRHDAESGRGAHAPVPRRMVHRGPGGGR